MAANDLAGLRLLLVDDESLVLMLLEDLAASFKCIVAGTAAEVAEGTRLARELEIDAAVIDVNLRGATSYPIAAVLAARGLPFMFSTGYGQDGIAPEWRDRPVLQKPFEERQFASVLLSLRQPP